MATTNAIKTQRLAVLGAGESGVGAAILGVKKGYSVLVSDSGTIKEAYKEELNSHGIVWEEGQHSIDKIYASDLVIKSPGIPDKVPLVQELLSRRIAVISEIEFAARHTAANLIGITGSNGKTTTTMLTHHILEQDGLSVHIGGNIGQSFARQVALEDRPNYVLEISSFQLDGIVYFAPHIAIITNITPDHLDRYDQNFDRYVASKFRIAKNQTASDYLIYDADDPVIANYLQKNHVAPNLFPFSLTKKLDKGVYIDQKHIVLTETNFKMPIEELRIKGKHNLKNAMGAVAVSQLINIRKKTIRDSFQNFQGVDHRLEEVQTINKIKYINDSKATNVNATFFALDAMQSETIWIAGGKDKGNDYSELYALVNEKVKAIICLGIDNSKIIRAFANSVPMITEVDSMEQAVSVAHSMAQPDDNVLLSPACASFDRFTNYEERGDLFKKAVAALL